MNRLLPMPMSGRPPRWISKSVVSLLLLLTVGSMLHADETKTPAPAVDSYSSTDVVAAQQLVHGMGVADWLGPLAPVALSPFFGITCLSGMAIFGKGWVSAENPFLGATSPLNNPAVFWTFLALTLVTSIPRFTKVSKPFAQAVDQVEAWAGIITLLTLKVLMSATTGSDVTVEAPEVVQLGVISVTVDTLLMVAAAINIFVINTVKFFFEVLIWITPVPAIDAVFEVANKTACAVLMAIYGFSPTIATVINLAMLAACLVVFRWIYRREVFFRTMLLDAVWALISPPKTQLRPEVVVFPVATVGTVPARSRCILSRSEAGWLLTQCRLLRDDAVTKIPFDGCRAELVTGYFTNSIRLSGSHTAELTFSRWYNGQLPALVEALDVLARESDADRSVPHSRLKTELA
ncbi:MAG: hypothetical protein R3C19_05105 [Planctomycetaceae bacterium]